MALNLSTPTAIPLPPLPSQLCDPWFGSTSMMQLDDCQTAWNRLPVQEGVLPYRPLRKSLLDPPSLLVVEKHGTCELRFHASGKWVEENDFTIDISPNHIRNMFGALISKCGEEEDVGGMATDHMGKTLQWFIKPDTEFPGEPPRRPGMPRVLYIPESATFLTAMIWMPRPNARQFEPGANHPNISAFFKGALEYLARKLKGRDPAYAQKLSNEADFLGTMSAKQERHGQPRITWWGTERTIREDGSLALLNTTGLQGTNATFPGLISLGDEDCTTAVGGPARACSISRRSKRSRR